MSVVHGGNVFEIAFRLGCAPEDILDYSASINPLGPPEGLLGELEQYFHRVRHYPDIRNLALVEALADFHGVSPEQVVVGNGSTELIYALPQTLGVYRAAAALPTFGEYRRAFEIQGGRVEKILTSPENLFQPTVAQIDAALDAAVPPDAILATSPGSPSGCILPEAVRDRLLERCKAANVSCIVDEVFMDFCEDASMKEFLGDYPNLVLIRSMTKFYGIPGLRIGYLLTSEATARRVRERIPPWSVNTLAQIAGVYCLRQEEYRQATLRLVEDERSRMRAALDAVEGFRALPGRANYLVMELGEGLPSARTMRDDVLASDRILIRDCSSFEGMNDRYVRLAVRLPEENDRLLYALIHWAAANAR